jgi:hypothetical protein
MTAALVFLAGFVGTLAYLAARGRRRRRKSGWFVVVLRVCERPKQAPSK